MKTLLILAAVISVLFCHCSKLGGDYGTNNSDKCRVCHQMPPKDRVHAAHTVRRDYDCSTCHKGYSMPKNGIPYTDPSLHANGHRDILFTAAQFPLDSAAFDESSGSCRSVYCHGGIKDGTRSIVNINDSVSVSHCAACHDILQMTTVGHGPHFLNNAALLGPLVSACGNCHTGYSLADSTVNSATHINGRSEPVDNARCAACHTVADSTLPPSHLAMGRADCILCHVIK
jgi:hypothetical protein